MSLSSPRRLPSTIRMCPHPVSSRIDGLSPRGKNGAVVRTPCGRGEASEGPGAGRHRRRRHRRLQHRLPPGAQGVDRRAAPRQGRAHQRVDVARRGDGDALPHLADDHAHAAVLDPPLPEPPGGAGLARALARGREPPGRLEPGPVALPAAAGRDGARPRPRRGHDLARGGAAQLFPLMSPDDLHGAMYLPGDGWIDPSGSTTELARRARALGVAVETGVRVTGIERSPDGAIAGVVTDRGRVRAEIVVNAAGMWGRQVAAMAGVSLPITPLVHQHLATKPIPGPRAAAQDSLPPRSGEPGLPPRGGRRLPDRRLRAGARGLVGGRRAVGLHPAAPPVGLGALRRDHGGRDPARADPRPRGDGPPHERARGHHPGQPAAAGARARRAGLLGGGRALPHGLRRGRARSATSSRSGSSRESRPTTSAR